LHSLIYYELILFLIDVRLLIPSLFRFNYIDKAQSKRRKERERWSYDGKQPFLLSHAVEVVYEVLWPSSNMYLIWVMWYHKNFICLQLLKVNHFPHPSLHCFFLTIITS